MTAIQDSIYRCPVDLVKTPTPLERVIIIGSCLVSGWKNSIESAPDNSCQCDFFLLNNAGQLPDSPPQPITNYNFQVVQIPLRTVLPDGTYFRLSYANPESYERLFQDCCTRLSQFLTQAMRWNQQHGILTFVANFLVPQQNPLGRLLPRYDLRNFVHFVSRLNEVLEEEIRSYKNAFLLDIDQIASTYGRRYLQDDAVWHTGHASALSDWDHAYDQERIERVEAVRNYYPTYPNQFIVNVWNEVVANYRTIRQLDIVKLVVLDVDDTLWRGVAAERNEISANDVEGWPLGIIDALGHLKRRGVLLAIASKNTEERLTTLWRSVFGNRLSLDDFAVRKINWRSKAENIEEILSEVNLLPRNVLFVDDNPRERADVQAAFPDIRAIGSNPYLWRRILLWSAETQVATITGESATRTEMVRAQVQREVMRKKMTREEFLASLQTKVQITTIERTDHAGFARALELINKTNQFNTNGKRWTQQEFEQAFLSETRLYLFEVRDKFTDYGIVGVVVMKQSSIEQLAMSCRIVGLDVENAVLAYLIGQAHGMGHQMVSGIIKKTDVNLLCQDLYQRCGFEDKGDRWERATQPAMQVPSHVEIL